MTKEITKAFILQQIQDKFKLRDLIPDKFTFSEMVIPTYNIEQHVAYRITKWKSASITSTGAFELTEIKDNERWTMDKYDVVFMGAGAYTVSGIYVERVNRIGTATIYLDLEAGRSTSYHVGLSVPIVLEPGDKLYVNADGYTSTQDLRIYMDLIVEEIR